MSLISAAVPVGLTDAEAAARFEADGPNELPASRPRTVLRQFVAVIREPMLLLLLAAGTVNFLLAEPLDGGILLVSVIVVIGISLYQEHRTEGALAALRDLSAPRALVVRGGRQLRIPGREVVRGDVLLVAEGDRVPADARLVESVNLRIDESTLTGESMAVRKRSSVAGDTAPRPGGDDSCWLFSGTLAVAGHGVAIVEAVGLATELGKIGVALHSIEAERTRLQQEIDRLVRVVAVIGAAAALAVIVVYGLVRGSWLEALLAGIATAMSVLPEEFPVVLTVFLAIGAWRMSQRQVLTRRSAVIETLGSATVLCVDKTGTITLNSMAVQTLVTDRGEAWDLDERALPEPFHAALESAVLASPVDAFDPMDRAVRAAGTGYLGGTEHVHDEWILAREYPLSEELLALSHVWHAHDRARYTVAAKGAPEAIIDLCHLDASAAATVMQHVETLTSRGQRVLGIARATFSATTPLPDQPHEFDLEYLGLIGLHDPIRPGAADAVATCARAGVRTVMITGDHPGTAIAVAGSIGMADVEVMTGPELERVSDDELLDRVRRVNVYARMVPEQKLRLVGALQRAGDVVVMTGDGVNDAPALRAADVGLAMGARGTDVAREAAAMVITDDDISSIERGIRQGRVIFDNLRKAMSYIVAVHISIIGMAVIPLLGSDWPLVLLPIHLAVLELVIDPACSIVFEAEQADPAIMDQPPRPAESPVFGRRTLLIAVLQGFGVLAAVIAVYGWSLASGRTDEVTRSVTFVTIVLSNVGLILVNRSWRLPVWRTFRERRNAALGWVLVPALLALVLLITVPGARQALDLGAIGLTEGLVCIGAAAFGLAWFEIDKLRRKGRPIGGPAVSTRS